ncbi:AlpA family phage regulatory protein [Bradyrhizobium sp. LjRoot220]|uniref:helix-turn-helix transcriptional regulator n=1 Tax=Bradyrhizobium sp. LjRoot220 TaxID=3342284 RepID=UPI003ECF49AB
MTTDSQEPILPRFLRLPEVLTITGYSAVDSIYRKMREGTFPRSVKLGARAIAWREADIAAWVKDPSGYRAPAAEQVA